MPSVEGWIIYYRDHLEILEEIVHVLIAFTRKMTKYCYQEGYFWGQDLTWKF
jgi:hypothetical protein